MSSQHCYNIFDSRRDVFVIVTFHYIKNKRNNGADHLYFRKEGISLELTIYDGLLISSKNHIVLLILLYTNVIWQKAFLLLCNTSYVCRTGLLIFIIDQYK